MAAPAQSTPLVDEARESLARLRAEVDAVDAQLIALLRRRLAFVESIAAAKALLGMLARDPSRERQLFERVERGPVRDAYAAVVGACRDRVRELLREDGGDSCGGSRG